jgi:hypothetical protein
MNGTQRKAKSRIAAKLGLVAAPSGYVGPIVAEAMILCITRADRLIKAEMEAKK